MKEFKKFVPLVKVEEQNDGTLKVYGLVTAEAPDRDGEICHFKSTVPYYKAMAAEFQKATSIPGVDPSIAPLRYMHGLDAVGKGTQMDFIDADKAIMMGFDVIDKDAITKVKKGVLTGFSQGGNYVKTWQQNWTDGKPYTWYTAKVGEISLVDSPCLESARFEYVKADGSKEMRKFEQPLNVNGKGQMALLPTSDVLRIAEATAAIMKAQDDEEEDEDYESDKAKNKKAKESGATNEEHAGDAVQAPVNHDPDKGNPDSQPAVAGETRKASEKKTKREAGEDLPASAFAYVGDPEKTDTWKFPLHFSTDEKSASHVRNALARWSQAKGIPADEKDKVRAKIEAAAKKYGVEVSDEADKIKAAYWFLADKSIPDTIKSAIFKETAKENFKAERYAVDVIRACKAHGTDTLAKSLWDVHSVADALNTLFFTQRCLAEEAIFEGDESPVPGDLAELLATLVEIFIALVGEETSELLAAISGQKGATKTMSIDLEKARKSVADHLKAAHEMIGDHHDKAAGMHKAHHDTMKAHLDGVKAMIGAEKASGVSAAIDKAHAHLSAHTEKAYKVHKAHHDAMKGHLNKMAKAIGAEEEDVTGSGPTDEAANLGQGGSGYGSGAGGGASHKATDIAAMVADAVNKALEDREKAEDERFAEALKAAGIVPEAQAEPATGVGNRAAVVKTKNAPYQTNLAPGKDQDGGQQPQQKDAIEEVKSSDIAKALGQGDTDALLKLAHTIKAEPNGVPTSLSGFVAAKQ